MAIRSELEEVKVMVQFEKGSQTIPKCNKAATDESLFKLGQAVGSLSAETVENIVKIQETKLIQG